jgi:polyisoprenoid-binding protein YceI
MKMFLTIIIILIVLVVAGILLFGSGAPEDVERATIEETNSDSDNQENQEANDSENEGITNEPIYAEGELESKIASFDAADLNFRFTGFGPGKSHTGTFDDIQISNVTHNGQAITGGEITIGTSSVNILEDGLGKTKLEEHLCNEDFFECDTYPEIKFLITDVTPTSNVQARVSGDLLFKGVEKQLTFTVTRNQNTYSADFILDTTPFGFKTGLADQDVQIKFNAEI